MIAIKISSVIELTILTTAMMILAVQIFFHLPLDGYVIAGTILSLVVYGAISVISLTYLNKKAKKCSPKHKK